MLKISNASAGDGLKSPEMPENQCYGGIFAGKRCLIVLSAESFRDFAV